MAGFMMFFFQVIMSYHLYWLVNFSVLDADPQLLFRHVLAKVGWSKVGLVFFLLTFYFCIWLIGIAHVTWFAAGLQGLTCDLGAKL